MDGRPPAPEEHRSVSRQAWAQSSLPLVWWAGGMVWVPALNEASRLTDEAKLRAGRVLVSADSMHSAGDEARHWAPCESVRLRGRSTPTTVYEPRTD